MKIFVSSAVAVSYNLTTVLFHINSEYALLLTKVFVNLPEMPHSYIPQRFHIFLTMYILSILQGQDTYYTNNYS